jgi:hypothetical protein
MQTSDFINKAYCDRRWRFSQRIFTETSLKNSASKLKLKTLTTLRFLSQSNKSENLKAQLSKEELRQLAAQRKAKREENKETYGYALVDDIRIDYYGTPTPLNQRPH